jgi:thioredoxin-like negative regulator of GroEL
MNRIEFKQFLSDNSDCLIIVKGYADWCAPCKRISPLINQEINALEYEHGAANVRFLQINVDDDADVAAYVKIQKLPTMISYISGEPSHAVVSANEDEVKHFFKQSSHSYSSVSKSEATF